MPNLSENIQKLYNDLISLTFNNENFFFTDQVTPMQTKVRIFNYRLAGFSDWQLPGALECRGIMFKMDEDKPVSLLSRPMEKFFNYAEVKAWEKLNGSPASIGDVIESVMIKEDGSLISTFDDSGYLGLKSKGSIQSEQSSDAMTLIYAHSNLRTRLYELATTGYTVNMEYVSEKNRIVIGYDTPQLIILNVRNNETGEYVPYHSLFGDPILRNYLVKQENVEIINLDEFVKEVYNMTGIEGYVVKTNKGFVKIKTEWYVNLHRTKDSINSNKDLFLNIAENTIDDLKQLFLEDVISLKKIDAFETMFLSRLNDLISLAFRRVEENKGKSRKDFAIALSSDLTPDGRIIFGPLMKYYVETDKEKLVKNIIDMMAKNYSDFIPDEYK